MTQAHIAELWIYPVKSLAGISVIQAPLGHTGLAHDREWMVVDDNGRFLSQRSCASMALIQPVLVPTPAGMRLRLNHPQLGQHEVAPPMRPVHRLVSVWQDTLQALDQGDHVANWLSQALGRPCRLVRMPTEQHRNCTEPWTQGHPTHSLFADAYPLLVCSRRSIQALNDRLLEAGHPVVDARRFRPNVLLESVDTHEEDEWAWLEAADGSWRLHLAKPCTRCAMPTVDPDSADIDPRLNMVLASYRCDPKMDGAVTFGMNAIPHKTNGSPLQVGQAVSFAFE